MNFRYQKSIKERIFNLNLSNVILDRRSKKLSELLEGHKKALKTLTTENFIQTLKQLITMYEKDFKICERKIKENINKKEFLMKQIRLPKRKKENKKRKRQEKVNDKKKKRKLSPVDMDKILESMFMK